MTGPVTVVVVDDQPPFRRAVAEMLAHLPGFDLVGQAATGEDAVTLAQRLRPRLVLMDVRLPGIDGAEAAGRILRILPDTIVVLVSTCPRSSLPAAVATCGAAAFLPKEQLDAERLVALADAQPTQDLG